MSFLKYADRHNTCSAKWDDLSDVFSRDDLLPFWVADMDFEVDDNISKAVKNYTDSHVFGYYKVPESYYDAFIDWERKEHGLEVEREWIRFSPGVVTGFSMAVKMLTAPGDSVMVSTPVYYPFINAAKSNDCRLIKNELVNENGKYTYDFGDLERKIVDNDVKAYILCSPHNPVGRVWSEDELRTILDICKKHGVTVISDEIHHDFVYGCCRHTPTLSLAGESDRVIMFTAASKSFNIAALQNSIAVIRNKELRDEWDRFTNGISLRQGNPLGYIATEAAYRLGKPWLDEVKNVICENYRYICENLSSYVSNISPLEGTYLAWVDLGDRFDQDEMKSFVEDKCRLAFDYGDWFGGAKSSTHIRINLATSPDNIAEMVKRIKNNIEQY